MSTNLNLSDIFINYVRFKKLFTDVEPVYKCSATPCGTNAVCDDSVCICLPGYYGDPYFGCKPECVLNSDCSRNRACIRNKCKDPCEGTCGSEALCEVVNHIPMCSCPAGSTGDPFHICIQLKGIFSKYVINRIIIMDR